MRLLYLNHNVAWSGGTFFRAFHFGRGLAARGHDVTLLTISPKRRLGFDRYCRDGVKIIETPDLFWGMGRTGWDPWDTVNRMFAVRGGDWDVIHAWDCRPAVILPALWARGRGTTKSLLVTDWCDWWGRGGTQTERPGGWARALYEPVESYFEEAFRADGDGATVISRALEERVLSLGLAADRLRLLPQGCDMGTPSLMGRAEAKGQLAISPQEHLLLTVGSMTSNEAELLFEALRELHRLRSDTRLVMVGKHRATLPPDLRDSGRVVEAGYVSDEELRRYTAAADALLVPLADTVASRARWPSKANPFLAAGRIVITTRVGDLAELLQNERAGIVAEARPESFASAISEALDSPDELATIEQNARRVAREILDWSRVAEGLENFYVTLIHRSGDVLS